MAARCISNGDCSLCFCRTDKGCFIPWIDGDKEPPKKELLDVLYKYQTLVGEYNGIKLFK